MKLRHYLGLSLRMYFGIILFVIPFAVFFLFVLLVIMGLSMTICGIIFLILFILYGVYVYTIKCPKCNTKLIETYKVFSKYYKGGFHKVPQKCPCCGLDLDEV